MQELEYKQYNAVVEQNRKLQQEIKYYRDKLRYISNAKAENYPTFRKMLFDLQRKANIDGIIRA